MGFFTGRVTCSRFKVSGAAPRGFGPDDLALLDAHALGKERVASADGVSAGWGAGDHILDGRFELEKNVINDALSFSLRVDEPKIPGDLLRAYTSVELQGLASQNPSGLPSARQKREARQLAKERLEEEAKDGRFTRRKAIPILWDALSNELLVGTASVTAIDRLRPLFKATFKRDLDALTAGRQAFLLAELSDLTRAVDDAVPTAYVGTDGDVVWTPDEASRDFLGNEFLLWLWHTLDNETDAITLSDDSEAVVMLARTLVLEDPRGQSGKESISSDGPTKLPEALRAIQSGKLPRKVGVTLVRHDQQYELTLQAETLAIGAARLPVPEETEERARLEERVTQLRHLLESLDLLYSAYLSRRLGDAWPPEMAKLKKWLRREERDAHGRKAVG